MIRKGEMSGRVAEAMGCSDGQGRKVLNSVIESVTEATRMGDKVVLHVNHFCRSCCLIGMCYRNFLSF